MLPAVTRPDPPLTGAERPMLTVWLDFQRATLLWKCEGLDGAANPQPKMIREWREAGA